MTENIEKFAEMISENEAWKAEFTSALQNLENAEKIDAAIAFAAKKGCLLTREDFLDEKENVDLDELDSVTGGSRCSCLWTGLGGDGIDDLFCSCDSYGAGAYNGNPRHCRCIEGGKGSTD